jgi:hypothetical protein
MDLVFTEEGEKKIIGGQKILYYINESSEFSENCGSVNIL